MTVDEAIFILDPETTREALAGKSDGARKYLVDKACMVAINCMRQYRVLHAKELAKDGTLTIECEKNVYKKTGRILFTRSESQDGMLFYRG